jgi:hypothetical protein
MDWTLSQITTKVRNVAGASDTNNPTDATLKEKINDYYQNIFPLQVTVAELKADFTLLTQATDDGEYTLSDSMLVIKQPLYIDGVKITFYDEGRADDFRQLYRSERSGTAYCITKPSLACGTSNPAAVANSAFSYRIQSYGYSKAAAETLLSGSTVPQSKYGAWRLEIAADGTISVVEAGSNATGYPTAAQAIEGLSSESSEKAAMGFVTAINTSGSFVPGTTQLSSVVATYTDGFNSTRQRPNAALLDGRVLYLGPKPNDIYQLLAPTGIKKPAALSQTTDTPLDSRWGPLIAYGTAIQMKLDEGDTEAAKELTGIWEHHKSLLLGKTVRQNQATRQIERRF